MSEHTHATNLAVSGASSPKQRDEHKRFDPMEFEHDLSRAEEIYRNELMKTEDAQEGIRAWMEKRPPKWSGR